MTMRRQVQLLTVLVVTLHLLPSCAGFQSLVRVNHSTITISNSRSNKGWLGASSSSSASSSTASSSTSNTNKFHEYEKPILLVGFSSPGGNELQRLANEFLEEHYSSSGSGSGSAGECSGSVVVPLVNDPNDNLLKDIQNSQLAWPFILLVDFTPLVTSNSDKVEDMAAMVQKLYQQAGLLSVYVNVDADTAGEDPTQEQVILKQAKAQLEESVLVPYSDYELCLRNEGLESIKDNDNDNDNYSYNEDWEHIQWELTRLISRARLAPAIPGSDTPSTNTAHLTMGLNTFFLSLSFPSITQVEPYVEQMCQDVDAMEYRADLLECRDNRFELLYGMQLLRKYCRPHIVRVPALPSIAGTVLDDVMPIVYTVRTQNQAGTYPDDTDGIHSMFDMLQWGLRGGVEVLDVESAWDPTLTQELLTKAEQRYSSQILGSHHVVGKEVSSETAVQLFQQCALNGRAHGAKVVLSIDDSAKERMAYEAAMMASSIAAKQQKSVPIIPNISLILGDVGQFSRIINLPFTPVTHESLPFKAAPGQLTAKEIMTTRVLTKIVPKQVYCILGHKIAYSVSPQMQGAAFAACRLPHQYTRADVETVEEFVTSGLYQSDDFGGCSVTIPHKQAIIPYVDVMSDAAQTIGSVNTLVVQKQVDTDKDEMKRVIYGDNTDWKGIFNPLERQLGGAISEEKASSSYALILGGGGTARAAAYAATKLGLKRVYYNRTPSKAQDLADSFGGTVITSLDQEEGHDGETSLGSFLQKEGSSVEDIRVVISTLPAAAEFVLPEWLLSSNSRPVIFDVNYKPYRTKLLDQAEAVGCSVVRGSEMLWEQGVGQFELWTGRTAPYRVMKTVVLQNCLPAEEKREFE